MKTVVERAPALRRNARGAFYVRLPKWWTGEKSKWFGSDTDAAEAAYAKRADD